MARVTKSKSTVKREAVQRPENETSVSKRAESVKADMDDMLDEIDAVLEENAEQFVANFVQKGGE